MKILLVYPEIPLTFWSFKHALKFISKKSNYPPLGLLTVAAMLPAGWDKKLVDMNTGGLDDRDILWADYVFISAMSIQRNSALEVISRCKTLGVKTVCGGPLFTAWHDCFPEVDHLVLNEAEITLPLFLRDLETGQAGPIYTSEEKADLSQTPVPLWNLIKAKKYAAMNIQYSRGCPFNCEFCDIILMYGRVPRLKSKEKLFTELEGLYRAGWRGDLFFVDDNFIANRPVLKKEILPALIAWMEERKYPFTFFTEASIDLSDDAELMQLMVRAGFDSVFVGIESPNQASLAECNKFHNKGRDMMACVKKFQKAGLIVQAGFIIGFDNDPPSIFETLIKFIQESGITTAMVGLLNAPRGTMLYKRLKKEGRLLSGMTGDNTDFSMNFIPKMNRETLLEGYKKIISSIYAPRYYYARVKNLFADYDPSKLMTGFRPKFVHISALVKSIVRLGIIGKERYYYWKLFFWTLFRKPKLFPLAITLAIYGFHFRKLFKPQTQ